MFFMTLSLAAAVVTVGLGAWLVKAIASRKPGLERKLVIAITGLYAVMALAALAFSFANL